MRYLEGEENRVKVAFCCGCGWRGVGFRVWSLGFLGSVVWGLGFRERGGVGFGEAGRGWGIGFRV